MDILVIGDPHAHPDYDNRRFAWAAKYAFDNSVDAVVCMGDWADMPSIYKADKGKLKNEGKRLAKDLFALQSSLSIFESVLYLENAPRRIAKVAQFRPRKIVVKGNHEDRLATLVNDSPELEGLHYDIDGEWRERHWEVYQYKETVTVGGFMFSHCQASGNMGKPIGGDRIASSLIKKCYGSVVVGHDHRFKIDTDTRPDGSRLWGISAGCFVHEDYTEAWCRQVEPMWNRGLLLLRGVKDGDMESFTWITMDALKAKYGDQ